jgi:hypothetical protein
VLQWINQRFQCVHFRHPLPCFLPADSRTPGTSCWRFYPDGHLHSRTSSLVSSMCMLSSN